MRFFWAFLFLALVALSTATKVGASRYVNGVEILKQGWGPENVVQRSGYIAVNKAKGNDGHLFFWMFESRRSPSTDPILFWFTGGPGCSSELAIFFENGPYTMDMNTGDISTNPYSWNSFANVVFIDQPVGTGFSYADNIDAYVKNETQVAEDMFEFFETFFTQFPQYQNNPLYFSGESYAGHYVPAIANRVYTGNSQVIPKLQGVAIGNGLTDPKIQYQYYASFAHDNGLINDKQYAQLQKTTETCVKQITNNSPFAQSTCNTILSTIQMDGNNFNVYDIRKKCTHPPLCYDLDKIDGLMQNASVQQSLGVSPKAQWSECNNAVHSYLASDWLLDCSSYLLPLLNNNVRVIIYAGKEDFVCNWYGNAAWPLSLSWYGQQKFNNQPYQQWNSTSNPSTVFGEFRSYPPLTFVAVDGAGHMVPMDQPQAALQMLSQFLFN